MIAIIPMKEHSARVPGKNIRSFCDKPLFYWIMNSLQYVNITKVVINTDSRVIADMVKGYFPDVEILYRPEELCGDMVTGNCLIKWTIEQLDDDEFLYTHTTNPLLSPAIMNKAIYLYQRFKKSGNFDSLLGVTKHHMRLFSLQATPINHDPHKLERSQDLLPVYEDNSTMYIFDRNTFSKNNSRIGDMPYMFEIPKYQGLDIDTEGDWLIAEAVMKCVV